MVATLPFTDLRWPNWIQVEAPGKFYYSMDGGAKMGQGRAVPAYSS